MNEDKRRRLMHAAIAFVAEGETPTTRQLVERAGVNIAAINYYFQGKDNLMAEALDRAALSDLEAWIDEHLKNLDDPREGLRVFCRYLARIHSKFWTFSHAQLTNIVLKGKRERATARAIEELTKMCRAVYEAQNDADSSPHYRAQVAAVSLMSSLHYISIFHPHFETMAGFEVSDEVELYAYVDELLRALGLACGEAHDE